MGMGIEPFSIHEWEWELIPIFWQRMGMGIELQFNSFSLDKNGDTLFREWTQVCHICT